MAQVFGDLGNLSGKFGDFVFRKVGKKTFLVKAPKFKKKVDNAASILRKEKFSICLKLTSSLRSIPALKFSFDRIARSPQKMGAVSSYLYKQLQGLDCSQSQLLPAKDFVFSVKDVSAGASGFAITTNALENDSGIYAAKEVNISLCASLVLFKEGEKPREKFQCIPVSSITQKNSLDKELFFELRLSSLQKLNLQESKQTVLLMALVIFDSSGNTAKNSNTVCIKVL